MAQIRIACLVGKTNGAGITSWYWQPSKTLAAAGWKGETLGKDEGRAIVRARELNAAVELWRAGGPKPDVIRQRRDPGTVGALVERYRREVVGGKKPSGAPLLRGKTIEAYETGLKRIEAWAGKHPLVYVTPARVRALKEATARPVAAGGIGHAPAYNMLKTLRQLFAFAEVVDLIPRGSNPATTFGLGAPPPRATIWELEDEAAFDAAAIDLGLPALALARQLAYYTAQREGDLIAFTEAQLAPVEILDPTVRDRFAAADGSVKGWHLVQGKTSTEYERISMVIPFEPELLGRVEAAVKTNRARDRGAADPADRRLLSYVLVDDRTGQPWQKRNFIRAIAAVLAHAADKTGRAGMTGLVWHDLRRTRVVRLRRQGMDPAMIASLTGHRPRSIEMMLKVYGPVDSNITAAALAASLPIKAEPAAPTNQRSRRA